MGNKFYHNWSDFPETDDKVLTKKSEFHNDLLKNPQEVKFTFTFSLLGSLEKDLQKFETQEITLSFFLFRKNTPKIKVLEFFVTTKDFPKVVHISTPYYFTEQQKIGYEFVLDEQNKWKGESNFDLKLFENKILKEEVTYLKVFKVEWEMEIYTPQNFLKALKIDIALNWSKPLDTTYANDMNYIIVNREVESKLVGCYKTRHFLDKKISTDYIRMDSITMDLDESLVFVILSEQKLGFAGYFSGSLKDLAFTKTAIIQDEKNNELGNAALDISFGKLNRFLEFKTQGLSLSTRFVIDFSAKNGVNLNEEASPHFFDPKTDSKSAYEKAICWINELTSHQDDAKLLPGIGFGADFGSGLNEAFALNKNDAVPFNQNYECLLENYRSVVTIAKPGDCGSFLPSLNEKIFEGLVRSDLIYGVIIVMTPGGYVNTQEVIKFLNEKEQLPLSLIFVGIPSANSDFSQFKNISHNTSYERSFVHFADGGSRESLKDAFDQIPADIDQFYGLIC